MKVVNLKQPKEWGPFFWEVHHPHRGRLKYRTYDDCLGVLHINEAGGLEGRLPKKAFNLFGHSKTSAKKKLEETMVSWI